MNRSKNDSTTEWMEAFYRPKRLPRAWPLVLVLGWVGWNSRTALASDAFTKPTAQELAMTSLPGYPGAAAVVLYREEITRDDLHVVQHYDRIKVLTEEGKRFANVELGFVTLTGTAESAGDDKTVDGIVGRTVHADGTSIPFTGKPYRKVLEKANGYKVQQQVFTLPDVEVGSIVEYRYDTRINDHIYEAPTWLIQDDVYVKQAHFAWYPTTKQLMDGDKIVNAITWFPILPEGAKIESHEIPSSQIGGSGPSRLYELTVHDVAPKVKEEYMPPISSFSYRVIFNYTPYQSQAEFWKNEGKTWSKQINSFMAQDGALKEATQKAVGSASTPEQKLRNIYAAVMVLENTSYTRKHGELEDKAAGIGKLNHASDVLAHERGTPMELTQVFIAMARAAGFAAYGMLVPDRSESLFVPYWQSFRQFDDLLAIVNVDGKEMFFDPGSRYCPFGQLKWEHTYVLGLRQTADGTAIAESPGDPYKTHRTARVANLTMDEQGRTNGKVDLTFYGAPALYWRQAALRGDEESLRKELRESAERMLPKSLEVEVAEIKGIKEYEEPFAVTYKVKGTLGAAMGKRTMVPADLFLANESATFPHDKREMAVDFHYARMVQDAIRIKFPATMAIEAVPAPAKISLHDMAAYTMTVTPAPTNVTTRRDFVLGGVIVLAKNYGDLRSFYSQLESKDQESIVLKGAPAGGAAASGGQAD